MNHQELYQRLNLPEVVIVKLNNYANIREFQLSEDLKLRIINRLEWDEAVKELQTLLKDDPDGIKILWEMLDLLCNYTYPKYMARDISDEIFIATTKFITRSLEWQNTYYGENKFTKAHWFPRELAAVEFRIGALEYEFVDGDVRKIGVHIPSDAVFTRESVLQSLKDFAVFRNRYFPDWKDVTFTCNTWMLAPAMEELLNETSNILAFKHMFELDTIDLEATWFMGLIFPGYFTELADLPEKSSLQKKAKEYLLSGKKIGVAKGHLRDEFCV